MSFMIPTYTDQPMAQGTANGEPVTVPWEYRNDQGWDPVEGEPNPEKVSGWFSQLSAPGYLDCTGWSGPFERLSEALQDLADTFECNPLTGDDSDATEHEIREFITTQAPGEGVAWIAGHDRTGRHRFEIRSGDWTIYAGYLSLGALELTTGNPDRVLAVNLSDGYRLEVLESMVRDLSDSCKWIADPGLPESPINSLIAERAKQCASH